IALHGLPYQYPAPVSTQLTAWLNQQPLANLIRGHKKHKQLDPALQPHLTADNHALVCDHVDSLPVARLQKDSHWKDSFFLLIFILNESYCWLTFVITLLFHKQL